MKKITTLLTILICLATNAQIGSGFNPSDLSSISIYNSINTESGKLELSEVNGSPFLNEEFSMGKIIDQMNDKTTQTYLRYNIFEDKIEIKPDLSDQKLFSLNRSINYEFVYQNKLVKLIQNNDLFENNNNGYLFVLFDSPNNINLYKRYYQDFIPPKEARTSYDTDKPAKLETNIKYLISSDPSEDFIILDVNKRRILDAFDKKFESQLESFIKSKKYKFRGSEEEIESQLINLIEYYNTLL